MFKQFCLLIWILFSFYPMVVYTQSMEDSIEISVKPYIGLRGHLAIYEREMEVQDNASRLGVELSIKKKKLKIIAGAEIQMNIFRGGSSFNTDGNLSEGFLTVQSEQKQQLFASRLGYFGLDFDKYGLLTIGKQWSVYRDVTSYTDKFNVFGAIASATFIGGTDGGASGTGRADQSIIYRNQISLLDIGIQVQARGGNNDRFIDGFGVSIQTEVQKDFSIGIAYNKAFLSKDLLDSETILGLSGHPTYFSLGTRYIGKKIDFSVVGILQKNGDFVQGHYVDSIKSEVRTPSVVFNAKGLEVFGKYKLQRAAFFAGYNLYIPDIEVMLSIPEQYPFDFKKNDIIVGVVYQPMKFIQMYSEQRISFGRNVFGNQDINIFTIGMKIELSKQYKKLIILD